VLIPEVLILVFACQYLLTQPSGEEKQQESSNPLPYHLSTFAFFVETYNFITF
jgi:hypothetical protein